MRVRHGLFFTVLTAGLACGEDDRPPPFVAGSSASGGGPADGGLDVEAPDGEPALCGQEIFPAVEDPPNLYFVLDRSGSMNEVYEGSGESKYAAARDALASVLRAVGHRVRYGAAVFPAISNPDGCAPGHQVFPTTSGDPPAYAAAGQNGPVLTDFVRRLGYAEQEGGTPTAATLRELRSTLLELGPRTHLVLATDGAPNCNPEATCEASACIPNIEGDEIRGHACTPDYNCCDPANASDGWLGWCVDSAELEGEISALFEAGIATYVVGMPGAEAYGELLGRLAELGGTARASGSAYYAASDSAALSEALRAIGTGVAISCSIDLAEAPPDQNLVNVYFDGRLVPFEPEDGWSWTGQQSFELQGAACAELESGDVLEAQITFGCPTAVTR